MSTFAFVYPGQGAQRPGMGRALYDAFLPAKEAFDLASETLGRDMKALCFEADESTLSRTENAQLALFTVSMATHWVLQSEQGLPAGVAGFSLGECVALCAAGYLRWHDGLRTVRVRAESMQREAERHPGAMAAVLGLDWTTVEAVCRNAGGFAHAVNDNAPGQVVMAGEPQAIARASAGAMAAGATKVVPLALSAAFHTIDMKEAGNTLEAFMRTVDITSATLPVYTNRTGDALKPGQDLPAHMGLQLQNPVRWQRCVTNMISDGITTFVEVGEGKTLTGFLRRIDRSATGLTTDTPEAIEKVLSFIRDRERQS